MPQAWPVGFGRYLQILRPDPEAPRVEREAWTQETSRKHRYGTGVLFRPLPGRWSVGIVLGRWTSRTKEQAQEIETLRRRRDHGLRVISSEDEDQVLANIADWEPPVWHWRFYREHAVFALSRLGVLKVGYFGDVHWVRPAWSYRQVHIHTETSEPVHVPVKEAAAKTGGVEMDAGWNDEVRRLAYEVQQAALKQEEEERAANPQPPRQGSALTELSTELQRAFRIIGEERRDDVG